MIEFYIFNHFIGISKQISTENNNTPYIHTQFLLNFNSKFLLQIRQISQVTNPISRHWLFYVFLHMWIILQYTYAYFFVVSFSFGVWLNVCGLKFYIFCEILLKNIKKERQNYKATLKKKYIGIKYI